MAAVTPSRLYPDSRPSPSLLQPPGMSTAPQTPVQFRGATTPPSPPLDLRLPRPTNDCGQFFAAVEQAASAEAQTTASQAGQGIWQAISQAFAALHVQSETWAHYMQTYATTIEAHHASFHKAKKAFADLHGLEHEMEVSAAQKFAALDHEIGELRQAL